MPSEHEQVVRWPVLVGLVLSALFIGTVIALVSWSLTSNEAGQDPPMLGTESETVTEDEFVVARRLLRGHPHLSSGVAVSPTNARDIAVCDADEGITIVVYYDAELDGCFGLVAECPEFEGIAMPCPQGSVITR